MGQTTKALSRPCVLGVADAQALSTGRFPNALWECGGVELRADALSPAAIAGALMAFDAQRTRRNFSGPVIFTLRLRRDMGAWEDAKSAQRDAVWESLPPGVCEWVDIEIEEIDRVSPVALDSLKSSGTKILLSHHSFDVERARPGHWEALLGKMRGHKPDGVKFAVALGSNPNERVRAESLLAFARRVAAGHPVSAVFGMGEEGRLTRIVSPLLGCPWTYGHLGPVPGAPGQLSAALMREFFARAATEGAPEASAPESDWLDWADSLLGRIVRA